MADAMVGYGNAGQVKRDAEQFVAA